MGFVDLRSGATISSMVLSPTPMVLRTRETRTPWPASFDELRLDLVLPHALHLGGRAGHGDDVLRVAGTSVEIVFSTHQPGAVPRGLGMAVAEGMSIVCLRLRSAKATPRAVKKARRRCSASVSTNISSPRTCVIASRVRSSSVGPRPPVMMMTSERARALLDGLGEALEVIADGGLVVEVDADGGEAGGDVLGVGVEDFAEEDLGADGDEFGAHGGRI